MFVHRGRQNQHTREHKKLIAAALKYEFIPKLNFIYTQLCQRKDAASFSQRADNDGDKKTKEKE